MFNIVLWQKGMPERFFKYSITENDTVQIDHYTGPFFLLNIPDTIEGKQVTSIGCGYDTDPAYFQCHETFADMKYFREVSLQQSLKSIGNNAFANCIPSYIFSECYSLEKITIPASVEEIGERYMNTFAELAGSAFFCEKKILGYIDKSMIICYDIFIQKI